MNFESMLFMFFAGVLAHALGIRLFNIWNKSLLFKTTFINCLVILRFAENISRELVATRSDGLEENEKINTVFKHWQKVALFSLKNIMPDSVWQQISSDDWNQAMRILSAIENKGAENESQ